MRNYFSNWLNLVYSNKENLKLFKLLVYLKYIQCELFKC